MKKKWLHLISIIFFPHTQLAIEPSFKTVLAQICYIKKIPPKSILRIREICKKYNTVQVENINFANLKLITKTEGLSARKVYLDKKNKEYLKIWPKECPYASFFINALEENFYEGIAPLKHILIDQQHNIRGYTTYAIDNYKQYNNYLSGNFILDNATFQNDAYKLFLKLLIQRTKETHIIHYDIVAPNLVYDGHAYFIIDLEAVIDVKSAKNNELDFKQAITYCPIEYREFIIRLLQIA